MANTSYVTKLKPGWTHIFVENPKCVDKGEMDWLKTLKETHIPFTIWNTFFNTFFKFTILKKSQLWEVID